MKKSRTIYLALLAVLLSPMAANAGTITQEYHLDGTNYQDVFDFYYFDGSLGTLTAVDLHFDSSHDVFAADDECAFFEDCAGTWYLDLNTDIFGILGSAAQFIDTYSFPTKFNLSYDEDYFGGGTWTGVGTVFSAWNSAYCEGGYICNTGQYEYGNFDGTFSLTYTYVPEPGTLALLGLGLLGMAASRRRRKV